jgi:N-acetylmuramoyl-L-alanine amidase
MIIREAGPAIGGKRRTPCYDVGVSARARFYLIVAGVAGLLGATAALSGQAPDAPAPLTIVSRDGRKSLATAVADGHEVIGLDDLAAIFQLSVREDVAAGALTVSYKGRTIVLTPDQALASTGGRLISLSSPPRRLGRRWVVPIDFISRALAPVYDGRIELRPASRLIVVGDLRIPRVTARYDATGTGLRVSFEIAPRVAASVAQEQGRLLVRLEADGIDAALPPPPAQGLIAGMHAVDPGTTIQIDLGPRFASYRTTSQSAEDAPYRLVIELQQNAGETSAAPAAPPPAEPPPMLGSPTRPAIRTIVIDPGHGGDETGARGASGTLEKDVSLAVARRLKAAIEGRLGIRVLLTRDDDRHVGLDERAAMANNNKADVFISLHANASPRAATKGVEIFYLSRNRFADRVRQLAESQRELLPVFGGGNREIVLVQWDMAQAYHIDESAALAGVVEQRLRDQPEMAGVIVEQASVRVLTGANMPAVLVEMGYLSNPDQEQALVSVEFQNQVVQALLDAVVTFRERLEQGPAVKPATEAAPSRAPAAQAAR